MTLVDTSSWIHQLRPAGDATVRRRVESLLRTGEACWCAMVRVELWSGARGDHEKRVLRSYEQAIPEMAMVPEVWEEACGLARAARSAGLTCPSPDLIIAACARHHGCALETADQHLTALMAL